ncbi:hypothetical protein [Bradyrhizobium retamae]|uniref:hypothetical protein n=1 Tax=Bradyrhizobium retamae TaxID=1300035 RepID=UPI000B3046A6|nr:hypothetical protein [Bradyrhizobium retamae]
MWETYLGPLWNALRASWSEVLEVGSKVANGEWFIAIAGGIISSLLSIGLVSMRVPKLGISKSIALTPKGSRVVARIKVINRRRRWFVLSGDALASKAALYLVKRGPEEEQEITTEVELVRSQVDVIPHRRFFRRTSRSEFVFSVAKDYGDLPNRFAAPEWHYIRFQITSKDSFSNYERVYVQRYHKSASGSAARCAPFVEGDFRAGDLEIIPIRAKRRDGADPSEGDG